MDAGDVATVAVCGTLADGTPWPLPVTLDVPAEVLPPGADHLVLQDQEGSPLAVLLITERVAQTRPGQASGAGPGQASEAGPGSASGAGPGQASRADAGQASRADAGLASGAGLREDGAPADAGDAVIVRLAGQVTALREPEHGPFRQLRRRPADVRAELAEGPAARTNVLAYAIRRPLNKRHIGQLRHFAGQLNARLLVLPLIIGPAAVVTRPEALVRAVLAAGQHLPGGTLVVPVPLAPRSGGPAAELQAQAIVAAAYGATHLLADSADVVGETGSPAARNGGPLTLPGVPIPVISAGEWAYDPRSEVWRPLALIEPGAEQGELTDSELGRLLDSGAEIPAWFTTPSVALELRRARPPRAERGLAIFFTGLSGSGKSTIARGLAEALSERGDRTVSLLDGDHVRQLLSAGLTFSRADRDLNIARIGFVAAEVARHGGIAICAPIAPFAQARATARKMVNKVGDFLLIYVSTPVEVCAARDRKGLYAKAQAGLIKGFTGVSDPYEEPRDADLVLDTSAMTRQEAIDAVLKLLITGGWLPEVPGGSDASNGASATKSPASMIRVGPAVRRL